MEFNCESCVKVFFYKKKRQIRNKKCKFKVKFYPSPKNFTQACLWCLWQIPGLHYSNKLLGNYIRNKITCIFIYWFATLLYYRYLLSGPTIWQASVFASVSWLPLFFRQLTNLVYRRAASWPDVDLLHYVSVNVVLELWRGNWCFSLDSPL